MAADTCRDDERRNAMTTYRKAKNCTFPRRVPAEETFYINFGAAYNDYILDPHKKYGDVFVADFETADVTVKQAFKDYTTKNFLNSFFSLKFQKNKKSQIKNLNNYLKRWNNDKNLILVTHYVVILEMLNYAPSSGEIVVSDKNLNLIGTLKIEY